MATTEISIPAELIEMLQPGTAVRVNYGKNHIANNVCHIRAIVDDEYIAFRTRSDKSQAWQYHIEWIYSFYLKWQDGNLEGV